MKFCAVYTIGWSDRITGLFETHEQCMDFLEKQSARLWTVFRTDKPPESVREFRERKVDPKTAVEHW